jgi:hypothetical protein
MTGIASPDDWQGARNFACAGPVAFNTPVAVYGNKRSNSGRSESAFDRTETHNLTAVPIGNGMTINVGGGAEWRLRSSVANSA